MKTVDQIPTEHREFIATLVPDYGLLQKLYRRLRQSGWVAHYPSPAGCRGTVHVDYTRTRYEPLCGRGKYVLLVFTSDEQYVFDFRGDFETEYANLETVLKERQAARV